jgi:hypothetical protein
MSDLLDLGIGASRRERNGNDDTAVASSLEES